MPYDDMEVVIKPLGNDVWYAECPDNGSSTTIKGYAEALVWATADVGLGDSVTLHFRDNPELLADPCPGCGTFNRYSHTGKCPSIDRAITA